MDATFFRYFASIIQNRMTDEELVKKCILKRPDAQKLLFERFSKRMMGLCLRYADRTEEADDILQNGFIRVFENIHSFRAEGSLEGWIRTIMIHEALRYLKENKTMRFSTEIDDSQYVSSEGIRAGESAHTKDLLKMIQQLPDGFRTVFNLYAIEGYTHKEIAVILEISEGTSKSQYARAREHLQKTLKSEKQVEKYYEEQH